MKKIKNIILIITMIIMFFPFVAKAETEGVVSSDYVDVVGKLTNDEETNKVRVYLFHGDGCPHCADANNYFKKQLKKYKGTVEFIKYETWKNKSNDKLMDRVAEKLNTKTSGVPFIVIGDKFFSGYGSYMNLQIEATIESYLKDENVNSEEKVYDLPLIGIVDAKETSVGLIAVVLGIIDGFNPCAMWILLFLINMLFGMKNKKRMWTLGLVFLITSATVYFFAMLGITTVLSMTEVVWIRTIIGIVAILGGILSFRSYLKAKDSGCKVVDDKKRKKLFAKIKKITAESNFCLAIIGIIVLAVSVNLVELACSMGFPAIFAEILNLNNIDGLSKIVYLIIYVLFFMIDDIIIFAIAMFTLEATGISTKYSKIANLIGAIIMIVMGLLLIFKPEIIMLNF